MDYEKMPGHWLLASLGKKVLRPGGIGMTCCMLEALQISESDTVVEFAPGLGVTARMTLERKPAKYIAIEQDEQAASQVRQYLHGDDQHCIVASAEQTGLPDASATVIYGEAMLTMQSSTQKNRIIGEARRLLKPGGRYAIHEMCLRPEDLDAAVKEKIQKDLSQVIRVNARPLTIKEWTQLLKEHGFEVEMVRTAPMHLLRPKRMLEDEGLRDLLKIVYNVIRNPQARRRVLAMRRQFLKYSDHLQAVSIIARVHG
jgi:ubiquinone/menaquinone biosynthesis C-methylase UbiE